MNEQSFGPVAVQLSQKIIDFQTTSHIERERDLEFSRIQ